MNGIGCSGGMYGFSKSYVPQRRPSHVVVVPYCSAREQFAVIVAQLQSAAVLSMEHGEVERLVSAEGTELLRRLLQAHFDLVIMEREARGGHAWCRWRHAKPGTTRMPKAAGEFVRGGRGQAMWRQCPRKGACSRSTGSSTCPRQLLARTAGTVGVGGGAGFDEAVRAIEKTTGGRSPSVRPGVDGQASQDFEAFYEGRAGQGPEILIGKTCARGTKRAAEQESHKLKTRLSPGEKRNRKRMATVAAVYSIERQVRTSESVTGVKSEKDAPQPRGRNKRVWAGSVERSPEQVTEEVFQEALRRDPKRERPWLMLVDGHEEQLGQIGLAIDRHGGRGHARPRFHPRARIPLEGRVVFLCPGCEAVEAWVGERALRLRGKARDAGGDAAQRDPAGPLPRPAQGDRRAGSSPDRRDAALRPLPPTGLPHSHRGHRRGLSSHLVKDRMDITGHAGPAQRRGSAEAPGRCIPAGGTGGLLGVS